MNFEIIRIDDNDQLGTTVIADHKNDEPTLIADTPEQALLGFANRSHNGRVLIYGEGERYLVIAYNTNGAHHTGAVLRVRRAPGEAYIA